MTAAELVRLITSKRGGEPQAAVEIVDALLAASAAAGASDLHLLPTADGLALSWRIDGVLQPLGRVPAELAVNVVTRLKVMARLLTYRTNVPQEGRIAWTGASSGSATAEAVYAGGGSGVEVRVSTFPTLFGEKVVARNLPRGDRPLARLDDLGLPAEVRRALGEALVQTSGLLVVAGPAGSGKTTTAYACLREIIEGSEGRRSVATIEDPVEVVVEGVAQSQVAEAAGFDLLTGLRSLVRQDPEVIFIGEIRDAAAAGVAMQAALTGQLVITTFHATDAAVALSRLAEMGLPPYALRSGVRSVAAQRLVRRLCGCAAEYEEETGALSRKRPVGCEACRRTGYAGRVAVAEVLELDWPGVAEAVLQRRDATAIRQAAADAGMVGLRERAAALVSEGVTSELEVMRVFGFVRD